MKAKIFLGLVCAALLAIGWGACAPEKPTPRPDQAQVQNFLPGDDAKVFPVAPPTEARPAKPAAPEVPVLRAQVADTTASDGTGDGGGFLAWAKAHWAVLAGALFAIAEAIVRVTPTERDNSIVNWLKKLLDGWLPNNSATGGQHA